MSSLDHEEMPDPGQAGTSGDEGEYDVGYCKPPVHTQFKTGNKGGGRKKGSKNLKTIVKEALSSKVPAKINGKTMKMTKVELSVHQLANKASAGDLKAISKVVELYQMYGPQEEIGEVSQEQAGYDLETIIHHLKINGSIPWDDED